MDDEGRCTLRDMPLWRLPCGVSALLFEAEGVVRFRVLGCRIQI